MTLMELKEQIVKHKEFNHFYIFTGDETIVLKNYVNKLTNLFKAKTGGDIKYIDSLGAIYTSFSKTNLLKTKPCCYIIYDDKEYINQSESIWKSIISGKIIKDNLIILIYNNIDKRGKFYKYHTKYITLFDKLSNELLSKYVVKQLPELSISNANTLVKICENSYSRILLECDKLNHLYLAYNGKDMNKCFEYALQNSFIWIPPEDAIFSFVSACLNRNIDDCYYYLNECKLIGESELNILSNLYTNFRALFQVQSIGYNKDICNITGLQMYQVKLVSDKVNKYSNDELLRALRLIHYCESSIKNGIMESTMVLDFMLVNLL